MPILLRPAGDTDLSNATLHEDVALPQTISGLSAGSYEVGRVAWASDPVAVMASSGAGPLLLMVAGQSNARVAGNSAGSPAAKYLAAGAFGETYIYVRGSGANIAAEIQSGSFAPYDITSNADPDNSGTAWGSEAEFIWRLRQSGDTRPIYIVKEAQNGQDIENDWSPDLGGDNFAFLEAKVARARALAPTAFAAEVMLWNQGEANANSAAKTAAYQTAFPAFLSAFRARVSATAFFVAERIRPLGYEGASITDNSAGFLNAWAVREATIAATLADGNATTIDTDFLPGNFDSIHPNEPWTTGKGRRGYDAWTGTYDATYGAITDTTPDAFDFADVTEAAPGSMVAASPVLLQGIERQAPVTITGGEWRTLNSLDSDLVVQDWTDQPGVADKYQRPQVRTSAPAGSGATASVDLTIGSLTVDWSVTTFASAPSYQPETNAFITQAAANGGTTITGAQANALDSFYVTAKASTWFSKMLRIYGRLADEVSSSLDIADGTTSLTSVAPNGPPYAWSAALGWSPQDNSNTGLDLKVDPSTQLPQNDSAVGVFYSTLSADTRGELNGGDQIFLRATGAGAARYLMQSSGNTNASGLTTAPGLRAMTRTGAGALNLHGPDGSILATSGNASETPTGTALGLGNPPVGNLGGGIHSTSATFLGAFAADAALTEVEMQDFASAMTALHTAFAP